LCLGERKLWGYASVFNACFFSVSIMCSRILNFCSLPVTVMG